MDCFKNQDFLVREQKDTASLKFPTWLALRRPSGFRLRKNYGGQDVGQAL